MKDFTAKNLAKTGLMAALIFIFTYTFKIPSPNGYTHLGDCFILLGVLILGRKKGALAGGIGAALADFAGGYMIWVLPTFWIKWIMATIMGLMVEKYLIKVKFNYVIGAVIGGAVQVILYTVIKIPIFGIAYAAVRLPGLTIQTITGILITVVVVTVLDKCHVLKLVREI